MKINLENSHRQSENFTSHGKINLENSSLSCLGFQVEVVSPGWINLRLSHRGLATWLEHLHQIPSQSHFKGALTPQYSQNLFPVQYAHARCCSLLRSAHQQNLIQLKNCDAKTHPWQIIEPNSIPWLNEDQETLRLLHPAEKFLLEQLLDIPDALLGNIQVDCVKLALSLSQAFEHFERSCRIWGEVKTQTPNLAQARLGLVALTQALLQSLLEDHLASFAPHQL
jgi:arginyl-tRNA synthetase